MLTENSSGLAVRPRTLAPFLLLSALVAVPTASCKRKDPEKCQQGMSVARQAIKSEDFALAKQWREYAWKNCDDQMALQGIDQEIVTAEADVARRKAEQQAKDQERARLFAVFLQWAGANRGAPQNASKAVRCDPPAPPPAGAKPDPESKERWCSATRQAGNYALNVRYYDADREAVRFSTRPASPATCADLGEHQVVREWNVPAPGGQVVKRSLCSFNSGPLAGMQAVVSAAIADVHVFTPKYAQRDPRSTQ
jgi:hypothetical protein